METFDSYRKEMDDIRYVVYLSLCACVWKWERVRILYLLILLLIDPAFFGSQCTKLQHHPVTKYPNSNKVLHGKAKKD